MRCAWEAYVKLLPLWLRPFAEQVGCKRLLELRLRLGQSPELVTIQGSEWYPNAVRSEDLSFCINAASQYSPWSAATIKRGYITAAGGHRVGICGTLAISDGQVRGISHPTSVCLRVAREFPGIAAGLEKLRGSILIIGKPGWGKSTLLRDLIRLKSENDEGAVCVVDEKEELFPTTPTGPCFQAGKRTDIISACSKEYGIEAVLRNMCPQVIAVDEITAPGDCQALIHAGWCGVTLLATAHASCKKDLLSRPVYRPLVASNIFDTLVILHADKTWTIERMNV